MIPVRILYLSPRQCWPPHSGAKLRDYHLLRALATRATVHFAFYAEGGAPPLTGEELPDCASVHPIRRPAMYRPRHLLGGMLGRWPISVLNYTDEGMRQTAIGLAAENETDSSGEARTGFDYLHLDAIHLAQYPEALTAAGHSLRVVYNWHNIESEAMRRFGQTVASWPKKLYAAMTARKLEALEKRILHNAFGHIVCSPRERDQLLAIAPGARIEVVENGVDCAAFEERTTPPAELGSGEPRFVFVGSMDYYPNIEAILTFARQVWPAVRERITNAQLYIVGARPVEAVQRLHGLQGITVTGTVPDVRPYYHGAVASLVPLRTGGGTRLKILESMAAGVPVISSPLGAEGLHVEDGINLLLAEPDDKASWTRHMESLCVDSDQQNSLADSGLKLVRQTYDWPILGRKLAGIYQRWLNEDS